MIYDDMTKLDSFLKFNISSYFYELSSWELNNRVVATEI